ncbi:MAG: DUF493 family protein [Desulfobulbaceae bacterium]|nr:DUF493 family protein [Desulfobulbaceae bacterium]
MFFAVVMGTDLRYKAFMEKIPTHMPGQCRPRIGYPCIWEYKVIGMDRDAVRAAIDEHAGDVPYSLSDSRASSGGRYISMNLSITVYSDFNRLRLYELLGDHLAVKVVL